ncbi:hypothetical protein N9I05_04075, partial [Pseudomonadales bacterium]|nr:hypothetical protein [Pseudomonadales bacterium]
MGSIYRALPNNFWPPRFTETKNISAPAQDEKILANVDWNINDAHRAKFTYISTEGNTIREQNGNNFLASDNILGASSAWYDRSEAIETFTGHLFSDWTPNFSTQLKIA